MKKMHVRVTAIAMTVLMGASSFSGILVNAEGSRGTNEKSTEITTTDPNLDTDGDGLEDYLEEYFGTDKTNADTDGDGLSDSVEIRILKTDPLKEDTDSNGITDDLEDADDDDVSNLREIEIGTNPCKEDTDNDGLSDGKEIYVYHTSPILEDSDNDGLSDGEEVTLKLNPVKKYSKALVSDKKRTFKQNLKKASIDETLTSKENAAVPSISGKTTGVIDNNVSIKKSTVVLEELEDAMVGEPIHVVSNYEEGESLKLAFTCKGITQKKVKNFVVCHYDQEKDEISYLETSVEANKISAKITEGGTYFVIDSSKRTESSTEEAVAQILSASSTVTVTDVDTDYDGISDYADATPVDNSFTGKITNSSQDLVYPVSYAIDYRNFFYPISEFNSTLCKSSIIYATMAYNGNTIKDDRTGKIYNLSGLMSYHGLSDVKFYDLGSSYSDGHICRFCVGHRTVTYNGVTKDIAVVAVQGTDGTIEQWTSNFDIGTTAAFSSYADWTTAENHKGFDMAATRVLRMLSSYMSSYMNTGNTKAFLVTGHSRGGGIANILGAKLRDNGYDAYTYTFAAPNTTTKSESIAKSYTNIFNVVNSDDFIPYLPCASWEFCRYGRTSEVSIAEHYEKEWEDLTDKFDYNPDTYGMQDTITELGKVASTRNNTYVFTCSCHGNGTKNDITIRNYGMSKKSREEAIAKIPSNALPYCRITRYNGKFFWGWDFTVCQSPCYFMQVLAAELAGTISTYRFVVELNIADHYEDAKNAIISSAIGGLEHPHYAESYYVLAQHVAGTNFR